MLILFDYGHGGKDPRATYKDRHEAHDVLRLGQAVAKRLRAAGVQIDETRTSNTTFSMQQLVEMEKRKNTIFLYLFTAMHLSLKSQPAPKFSFLICQIPNQNQNRLLKKFNVH